MEYANQLGLAFLAHLGPMEMLVSFIGLGLGLAIGAVPGLNQGVLMALTLPLTMAMDNFLAQVLLIGMYVGGVSGAMVMGVLIGIPGSPAAIMTTLDGHAMAKRGEAARALALGVAAAFGGGLVSWIVLATLSWPLADIALMFTPFEFASLIAGGLMVIGMAGGNDALKGLIGGLLGILAALVGLDPVTSEARFMFGQYSLQAGFGLLPVLLGMFAVGQLLANAATAQAIAQQIEVHFSDIMTSVFGITKHWKNVVRSGLIGTWMGLHPGLGASIGSIIAYMMARNLSDDPQSFGTGREEGVVASEAGAVGTVGGALLPMITLGIPGAPADVILMAALVFHNVHPGPMLMLEHPQVFYGVIATFLVSLILMFVTLLPLCVWMGRLANLPRHLMIPSVLAIAIAGAYAVSSLMLSVWVMIAFGAIGWTMSLMRIPMPPFVIGFVLTPLLETSLRSALMQSDGDFSPFFTRPASAIILVASVLFVVWPYLKSLKRLATR
eukprot:gene4236-4286_t